MEKKSSLPLNHCKVKKGPLIINRSHALIHSTALALLIHYRASFFFSSSQEPKTPFFPWLLVFASELILSFIWVLGLAYKWRPVARTAFPESLPQDKDLPCIDIHICTADPSKEPTVLVMNTVLSAMALDYPVEKLHVYLSDDGGSLVTLQGMREAWRFARCWLPFCRRFGIKTRCPQAYFSGDEDHGIRTSPEFLEETQNVKDKYEVFKENIKKATENGGIGGTSRDHPPTIEIIHEDDPKDESVEENVRMPLLVYVAREKRPQVPHNFKAGALNVLLRVSGMMSNSPYILVLDCDMHCNDPSSARTAMCFHLDPKISPSLAFVQFPQRFHNNSKNDIYDSRIRSAFSTLWPGLDGIQGPVLSGSCFYIKRDCLYGSSIHTKTDVVASDKLSLLEEAQVLAYCTYEKDTKWGKEAGYLYESVCEDVFTGFMLHTRGWSSVYHDPPRAQFLGSGITNLNDLLTQGTRWSSGLLEIGLSSFCPLTYTTSKMRFLQSLCYAELVLFPLCYSISLWCLATIPHLCLLNGISLYPKVSDPCFTIFSFIFLSSVAIHVQEVVSTGGSVQTWINEHRIWMMKSITCHFYGSLDAVLEKIAGREASFLPTNKVGDEEQVKLYQMGKFDFRTSNMFLVPLVVLMILNVASLVYGVSNVIVGGGNNLEEMFVQLFISAYVLAVNYPLLEGMVLRRDKGCIPLSVTLFSLVFVFGCFFFSCLRWSILVSVFSSILFLTFWFWGQTLVVMYTTE